MIILSDIFSRNIFVGDVGIFFEIVGKVIGILYFFCWYIEGLYFIVIVCIFVYRYLECGKISDNVVI